MVRCSGSSSGSGSGSGSSCWPLAPCRALTALAPHRIELASSAGFPSLLDPSSGYTGGGGGRGGAKSTSLLDPSSGYTGHAGAGKSSLPVQIKRPQVYGSQPLAPKPKGRPSPRRTRARGAKSTWANGYDRDRPLARSWDRAQGPLVRSRMYSSTDSTSSRNGFGAGRSAMHHSGPFDYQQPPTRPALQGDVGPRPGTSPAHLALESQVTSALDELRGVMEQVRAHLASPALRAGPACPVPILLTAVRLRRT